MSKGLQFGNSTQIDPLRRQCSLITLQSEPDGHFAKLINHTREITGNYVNILLQFSQVIFLSLFNKYKKNTTNNLLANNPMQGNFLGPSLRKLIKILNVYI